MEQVLNTRLMHIALALASLVSAGTAAADTFSPVVTGGLTYSGDDWTVANTAAGQPVTARLGGKLQVGAGMLWNSADYPVQASLLATYQYDPKAGSGNSAKFSRAPIEGMVYWTGLKTVRFGVGLSYILSPELKAKYDGGEQTIKYKNAVGKAFEIGYALTPQLWANLRLSSEKYKPKQRGVAEEADVSKLGVNLSYVF
jgi:hypothetical protein